VLLVTLVTYTVITSISILTTFVGNLASAQNSTSDTSWLEGTINVLTQTNINSTENKASQSLEIAGLSPQGADDLAISCAYFPERC
jgi:hypothetical protein